MNNPRIRLEFKEGCYKAPFTPNNVVNLYIVYELNIWSQDLNDEFTLKDCFFRAVKLTKNAIPNKYSYLGYGIEFDSRSLDSISNFDWSKNAIIFGVDMNSSVYAYNNNKDILILGEGQTKWLDNTSFTAEAEYSINFLGSGRKFCSSLYYNESNSFQYANATKIHQFKAKAYEIKRYPLCLGNISKDFSVHNMKKTGDWIR